MVEMTGWIFKTTFTTVGFPYFNANVKKMVPTAEPANPEKSIKPHVRARIFGISCKREIRIGRNMIRMSTCSQKTITFASNNWLSGMRHALSVPQSAAPRPTSHGPYAALGAVWFCIEIIVAQVANLLHHEKPKERLTPQRMVC